MRLGKILIVCAVFAGAAAMIVHRVRANSSDIEGKMTVDGHERTYLVHVPSSYSRATPLRWLWRFTEEWARGGDRNGWGIWTR